MQIFLQERLEENIGFQFSKVMEEYHRPHPLISTSSWFHVYEILERKLTQQCLVVLHYKKIVL